MGTRTKEAKVVSLDLESRITEDDHQAIKLWLRLLSTTNLIEHQVRVRLRAEFQTTLPRFDLLAQLERHPAGLTMNELSQRMMVTAGNITRLVDELEREGLVAREPHPQDRRAIKVKLTPAGSRRFAAMAKIHEGWIIDLFAGLSREEKELLYRLLAKLKQHVLATGNEEAP
ncbi:MarR family transcriptional regulator [Thermaerobacter sp. FW80]|uniref:MarR family winged helix-turn-helix transcriptional regulator n=1 Tax=Thermaerobacter sp. FW80 TaxID=2546351 RepID=UPI0010754C0F|nr:MarR family transcriptional regulator [Thermaerobacter sp. FW80]QBS36633.1 MarR family transcriptional regulator [Thermaerobacter sp. FW80]